MFVPIFCALTLLCNFLHTAAGLDSIELSEYTEFLSVLGLALHVWHAPSDQTVVAQVCDAWWGCPVIQRAWARLLV